MISFTRLLAVVSLTLTGAAHADNIIKTENAKAGTIDWQLTNPAVKHEIEGYASQTSVNRGEHISLYVSTTDPKFKMEIFRLGWYGGTGGRRVLNAVELDGSKQPVPEPDLTTGLIECHWSKAFDLAIPANPSDRTDWASGVYLAKLTASVSHKQSYIMFVVRDDLRLSDFLFQSSVNTFQAYNNWGGKSLYAWNSVNGVPARKVSFNRPYAPGPNALSHVGVGSGEFLTIVQTADHAPATGWEYVFLRFLEREGYDVTYSTDVDTHADGLAILYHKALLIVGHSEYWSFEQRANVESARDRGVSLGFFSANSVYWQVRYEPSTVDGSPNRTLVGYKEHAEAEDPDFGNPATRHLTTVKWRDPILKRPEDALVGVLYFGSPVKSDIVVDSAAHWVFAGTGLKNGDHLAGLLGYEVDRMGEHTPPNAVRLTNSTFEASTHAAHSVVYTTCSGATIFATGSMFFNLGLDDYGVPSQRPSVLSHAAQQMTRNVLARLSHAQPLPPPVAVASDSTLSGTATVPLRFDGSRSYDPSNCELTYVWSFGDGTASSVARTTHTYDDPGKFTATLNVKASSGLSDSATSLVTIAPFTKLSGLSISRQSVQGGRPLTGTVFLDRRAPAKGAIVVLSSNNPSIVGVPRKVTVARNSTKATFSLKTIAVSRATTVTVAADFQGVRKTAHITLFVRAVSPRRRN